MLRHAIAVGTVTVALVAVLIYCITPDVFNSSLSVASYRARHFVRSLSVERLLADASGRARTLIRLTPARRRTVPAQRRSGSRQPVELRKGPDPFRPYRWNERSLSEKVTALLRSVALFLPFALLLIVVSWVAAAVRREKQCRVEKDEKMAACLARAVRQMESA